MPRGRRSSFTPEEDDIILSTVGLPYSETNHRLGAAGFAERTEKSLANRRYYLVHEQGQPVIDLDNETDYVRFTRLVADLRRLHAKDRALTEERNDLRAQIQLINQELSELAELLRDWPAE